MAYYKKSFLLDKAIKIVTAYAKSGGSTPLDTQLKQVYEELVRINDGIELK